MEADDNCVRGSCKQHISLGNTANAFVDDVHLDFGSGKLHQRIRKSFYRTVHITFHDHGEFTHLLACLNLLRYFIQCDKFDLPEILFALQLLPLQANLSGDTLGFHHDDLIAGLWNTIKAE